MSNSTKPDTGKTSIRVIDANRLNAQLSIGPRSSQNAVKHGLLSHDSLLSIEEPGELDKFRAAYYDKFQPVDDAEQILVDLMVYAMWRIDRPQFRKTQPPGIPPRIPHPSQPRQSPQHPPQTPARSRPRDTTRRRAISDTAA